MPAVVACQCGSKFQAGDHLAGQTLSCPTCGRPIQVPPINTPAAVPMQPSAAQPQASSVIDVRCQCGAQFMAAPRLAGTQAACPKCGVQLTIPHPSPEILPSQQQQQPAPQEQPAQQQRPAPQHQPAQQQRPAPQQQLPATQQPAPQQQQPAPQQRPTQPTASQPAPVSAPLGDPLAGDAGGSAGGCAAPSPLASSSRPNTAGYGLKKKEPKASSNLAPIAIGGGVLVGVVLIACVFFFVFAGGDDESVAQNDPASPTAPDNEAKPTEDPKPPETPAPSEPSPPSRRMPSRSGETPNPAGPNPAGPNPAGPNPAGSYPAGPNPAGPNPAGASAPPASNPFAGGTTAPAATPNPAGEPTNPFAGGTPASNPFTTTQPGKTPQATTTEVKPSQATGPGAPPALMLASTKWLEEDNAAGVYYVAKDRPLLVQYSWMTRLLPHLGHQQLFDKLDMNKPWVEGTNQVVARAVIPQFQNPGDERVVWKGHPFEGMGLSHFVGMAGIEDGRTVVAGELPRSDPRAGVFGYKDVAKKLDVTDGESQTIMVIGAGRIVSPWVQGGGATIRGAREPYFDKLTGFGSTTPKTGGVAASAKGSVAMMVDGSVRFLSADIDPQVMRAMCTIHGAETVDIGKSGVVLKNYSLGKGPAKILVPARRGATSRPPGR